MYAPAQVLLNARVWVGNEKGDRAEALCWRGERLLAVGTREDVLAEAGPGAEVWDVAGATVLPGFVDGHHHACIAALYGGRLRLCPPEVTDISTLQRALQNAASELPPSAWLIASNWDELLLAERRPPTRAELDEAVPDRPLMAMHYTCHRLLANSRALELAGIDRHTPDPSGGAISRGRGGLPDGLLIERGMSRVETLARQNALARDPDDFLPSGRVVDPEQRVTLPEALAAYTRHSAEAAGAGSLCGTLEAGKRADIVVLDGRLEVDDDLDTATVRATLISGQVAFGRLVPLS